MDTRNGESEGNPGTERADIRAKSSGSVAHQPAARAASVADSSDRDAARKAKKAEYARRRYWAKKGLEPPSADGRKLHTALRAPKPPPQREEDEDEGDDVSDDDDPPDAPDVPVKKAPPKRETKSTSEGKKPLVRDHRGGPTSRVSKRSKRRQEDSGVSKLVIAAGLIAAGLWLHSKSSGDPSAKAGASTASPATPAKPPPLFGTPPTPFEEQRQKEASENSGG